MLLDGSKTLLLDASRFLVGLDPGIVWAAALVAALAYGVYFAGRSGLDPRRMYCAGICGLLGGLWGSHLLGLVDYGSDGSRLAWLRFWEGGQSYFGGLLGGALVCAAFLWLRRLPVLVYADAAIPAVPLGYAIGRIGCFLNGDDYGTLTNLPWAVQFPGGTEAHAAHLARGWIGPGDMWSLSVHPVQLYASLLGIALFAILVTWRPERPGSRLFLFAVLYGAARFAMEAWLRGDFRAVVGPFSTPQVFSVLLVVAGLGFWWGARGSIREKIRGQAVALSNVPGS